MESGYSFNLYVFMHCHSNEFYECDFILTSLIIITMVECTAKVYVHTGYEITLN